MRTKMVIYPRWRSKKTAFREQVSLFLVMVNFRCLESIEVEVWNTELEVQV